MRILTQLFFQGIISQSILVGIFFLFGGESIVKSKIDNGSNIRGNCLVVNTNKDSLINKNLPPISYEFGELLYQDDFNGGLKNWVIESKLSSNAKVEIQNEKLLIDVNCGVTIWLKEKLKGNILIQYKRKVIMNDGSNDRLSDLNTFWMATDPLDDDLFTRNGVFSLYHSLSLYYVGIGGNYNSTSRFRKYTGNGERILHGEYTDKEHLLQPNRLYLIEIVVYEGIIQVFVDHEKYFTFKDDNSLTEGYFGFRTVKSHHEIDDLKIYRLK